MILEDLFPRKSEKTFVQKIAIDEKTRTKGEEGVIRDICEKYNISGKLNINETPGQKTYNYKRPGYRADIVLKSLEDSVRIKVVNNNLASAMNDLHRLHGYQGNWINIICALMYDLCCIALLAFAFTGVYLWWKLEKNKLPGLIFLLISSGLTVFTIWYIMAIG